MALYELHHSVFRQWARQAQNDPEFGGVHFNDNLTLARQAVKRFGGPKLQRALDSSGMGNHPEIIRAFWKMGRYLAQAEAAPAPPTPKRQPKDLGELFYPGFNGRK